MRIRYSGLAFGLALLLLAPGRPASAQSLASLAAASMTTTTTIQKAGCWGCTNYGGYPVCTGGFPGGSWNCTGTILNTCNPTSPGCGVQGALPLDPDGSAQYVSRSSLSGDPVTDDDGGPPVRRNCEGVVVARLQTADDIVTVRNRTGLLTL
jgi:hypothetical protein